MKVHSQPIYNEKYIKTKARICNDVVDEVFRRIKESIYYICIAAISIDTVMKLDKKIYPQVDKNAEECKYKIRK